MSFNYDQKIFATTEYCEALSLYLYCKCNKLNFENQISKRKKQDLNKFPDFVLDDCFLEVTRSLNIISGKQQKDIVSVFGHKNPTAIVKAKNDELFKYKGKDNHNIEFGVINNVAYAFTDLKNYSSVIDDIKKSILEKSRKDNIVKNDMPLDLFVLNYEVLDNESVEQLFYWYKKSSINCFKDIYINYLSPENSFCNIMIMNKRAINMIVINEMIDKNALCKQIFDLEWLDDKLFSKDE